MIPLRLLSPGDRVALVAPASSFPRDQVDAGDAELARLGFVAVYDESVFAKDRFVAGSAETRAKAINDAWADSSIAALVAVRGGYGSAHVLPLLDATLLRDTRKALIGYSDITAVLSFYLNNGLTAIHGPMVDRRLAKGPEGYDEASFRRVLMAAGPAGELCPAQLESLHDGEASGVLIGGTLSQIASLLGTPWALKVPPGAVMFLEDVNERPYRIHRLLTQLEQAGTLQRLSAIVFGEFPGCDEPGGELPICDVLHDFTDDFRGPVLFGFPSGHTAGASWTLPLGVRVRVVGNARPLLIVTEAAVA
ncbi:MAG: S66 peptidase family protein [Vicinamibacterales bacterium]